MTKDRFVKMLKSTKINNRSLGKAMESDVLHWEMDGQPIDVRKTVFLSQPDDDSTDGDVDVWTHQYFGYIHRADGFFGLTIVFDPARIEFSETQVQELFANTGLKPLKDGQAATLQRAPFRATPVLRSQ